MIRLPNTDRIPDTTAFNTLSQGHNEVPRTQELLTEVGEPTWISVLSVRRVEYKGYTLQDWATRYNPRLAVSRLSLLFNSPQSRRCIATAYQDDPNDKTNEPTSKAPIELNCMQRALEVMHEHEMRLIVSERNPLSLAYRAAAMNDVVYRLENYVLPVVLRPVKSRPGRHRLVEEVCAKVTMN